MFANSVTNFELLQITFPSVPNIINGNGEFISVFFAAESTVNVRSCKCSEISLFLLLSVKYEYITIAMYIIVAGIINVGLYIHITINNIKIIIKYI